MQAWACCGRTKLKLLIKFKQSFFLDVTSHFDSRMTSCLISKQTKSQLNEINFIWTLR